MSMGVSTYDKKPQLAPKPADAPGVPPVKSD